MQCLFLCWLWSEYGISVRPPERGAPSSWIPFIDGTHVTYIIWGLIGKWERTRDERFPSEDSYLSAGSSSFSLDNFIVRLDHRRKPLLSSKQWDASS